jgi:hypothetical protein
MGAELTPSGVILGQRPAALLMDKMAWISTRKHTYLNAMAEAAVVNKRPSFQPSCRICQTQRSIRGAE